MKPEYYTFRGHSLNSLLGHTVRVICTLFLLGVAGAFAADGRWGDSAVFLGITTILGIPTAYLLNESARRRISSITVDTENQVLVFRNFRFFKNELGIGKAYREARFTSDQIIQIYHTSIERWIDAIGVLTPLGTVKISEEMDRYPEIFVALLDFASTSREQT